MGDNLLYDCLPDRSIRVLTIQGARQPDAQIQGNISVAHLDATNLSRFSALSYVWGSPGDDALSILCGGIIVPVLPNLFSALRELRNKLGTFTIWVDAVCINQDDDRDKERQIPLMAEIYTKSEYVYVWLGDASLKKERAMEYLRKPPFMSLFSPSGLFEDVNPNRRLYSAFPRYLLGYCRHYKTLFPKDTSRQSRSSQMNPTEVTLDDIAALLDTDWLERIWTYQEILLASNPIIVCGHAHLNWSAFVASIAFLEYSGYFYRDGRQGSALVLSWLKLALTRECIRYTDTGPNYDCTEAAKIPPSSQLWSYIGFLRSMIKLEQRFFTYVILIPFWIMALLLYIILCACVIDPYAEPTDHTVPSTCQVMRNSQLMLGILVAIELLIMFLMRDPIMQPIDFPSGLSVDLVDALLSRKARLDHDKAFALRNIIQRLSRVEIPLPDYSQPLDETFSDLNWQLSLAVGCERLLTLASVRPLANHPSWMVDWSCKPDTFWLPSPGFWTASVQSPTVPPLDSTPIEDTEISNRRLNCTVNVVCRLDDIFAFTFSDNVQDMLGLKQNLETGLAIATQSAEIVETMTRRKSKLIHLLSMSAPAISAISIAAWVDFLYDNYKEPEQALHILANDSELIRTQMAVCNSLATNGRNLFLYSSGRLRKTVSVKHSTMWRTVFFFRYMFGICRDTVKEKDVLVEVPGAATLLIVSPVSGEGLDQVRLVSPAICTGEKMFYKSRRVFFV